MRNHSAIRALDAFRPGSRERYFNNAGELNAGSKLEALKTLASMMEDVASGKIDFTNDNEDTASDVSPAERDQALVAAFKDYASGDDSEWKDIGAAAATSLQTVMTRTGFARTLLKPIPFVTDPARVEVEDSANVVAVITSGLDAIQPVFISDRYIEVDYVENKANVRVLQVEINRGHTGMVEKVYTRTQQAIGVQEDRYYMTQVRMASNPMYGNPAIQLLTSLTPEILSRMRTNIEENGMPVNALVTGRGLWPDFVAAPFASVIDPVHQYELIRTGKLGSIFDMNIITDGFRPKNIQVMDSQELFMTATPEYHGAFGDIGPITATPRDNFDDGQSAKGWFMSEFIACVIANAKSVQLARRV